MEDVGIYRCYIPIYILFTIFIIPQAVCQNFATLIVTRAIAGSFGGVLQNVMDGIVADIFEGEEARLLPMTLYIFALVGGVSFGPVFGGAVVSHLNWRWYVFDLQRRDADRLADRNTGYFTSSSSFTASSRPSSFSAFTKPALRSSPPPSTPKLSTNPL